MTDLPAEQLAKAAATVSRITEFLACRRLHTEQDAARAAISKLRHAAADLATAVAPAAPAVESPIEPTTARAGGQPIDVQRVDRFTIYLRDLRAWFETMAGAQPDDTGRARLRDLARALAGIDMIAASMLDAAGAPASRDEPAEPPGDDTPAPVSRDALDAEAELTAARQVQPTAVDVGAVHPLRLEDTSERPLLQEFKGNVELTREATEAIDEFVQANGLELDDHGRRRLRDRTLRWIEATPEGQVLILKVGGLHGRREPYPSYVPKQRPSGDS